MKSQKLLLGFLFTGVFMVLLPVSIVASGGGGGGGNPGDTSRTLYDKGVAADKDGDFKSALQYFQKANDLDRNDPEILNMLAHTQRKLGMMDDALENYWKALKIKPDFPQAREYMGEAYIIAALEQIDKLTNYGKEGEQQRDLLVKAFRDAAAGIK
jgi:tetratricopeptide (TPR) repeat protein